MNKSVIAIAAVALVTPVASMAEESASNVESLVQMSLKELASVEVTSVSKAPEPLHSAPAVLYVITHDEIMRSGATSIPEALRLAPNILITQLGSSNYVAAANGFGGNPVAQNFSNKLLILIDGRSVYSPLFSGLYLDAQDVVMEDIDRIEVISGPGATLWGANAMNGVINIITRSAQATEGKLVSANAGNYERDATVRYGDSMGEGAFRVYGKGFRRDTMQLYGGADADDGWDKTQAGFRYDWQSAKDSFTTQGDAYRATEEQLATDDLRLTGVNVLTRWQHHMDGSELQVQAYYDLTERVQPQGGGAFILRTYDLEIQQSTTFDSTQRLVWGAGERVNDYQIVNSASLLFLPTSRALTLGNLFAQDTLPLNKAVNLTLGIKLEDDPYSGWALQPDVRLAWNYSNTTLIWAAASRAIRSPTPFDEDVNEKVGNVLFLTGNTSFNPETVVAYELGYRSEPWQQFSYVLSAFYNVYDDLRSIEPASTTTFLPLHWGNLIQGDTYGMTAWAQWQVTDSWRVGPSIRYLHKHLRFKDDASGLLGTAQTADDPTLQASIKSTLTLTHNISADAVLRYVGSLPDPYLPAYYELNAHLGWQLSPAIEASLNGNNLLHARHLEFPDPYGYEIARSVNVAVRWNF